MDIGLCVCIVSRLALSDKSTLSSQFLYQPIRSGANFLVRFGVVFRKFAWRVCKIWYEFLSGTNSFGELLSQPVGLDHK